MARGALARTSPPGAVDDLTPPATREVWRRRYGTGRARAAGSETAVRRVPANPPQQLE